MMKLHVIYVFTHDRHRYGTGRIRCPIGFLAPAKWQYLRGLIKSLTGQNARYG